MEKWLIGCGAKTSGVYRVFAHEAPIAVVYYSRGRVRFAHSAQAHDALALLHKAIHAGVRYAEASARVEDGALGVDVRLTPIRGSLAVDKSPLAASESR
jgi:hypothetical protein